MSLDLATTILVVLFSIAGTLSLYAAIANAEWFFRSPNVRMLTGSLRRSYARILYGIIGLAILAMNVAIITSTP